MKEIVENIYEKIKELSDLSLQRKLWLNENNDTGLISSYDELMNSLFDDYDFDNFIDNNPSELEMPSLLILELRKLRMLLNNYHKRKSDAEIITDPEWNKIVNQAKIVINQWDNYSYHIGKGETS